MRQSGRQADTPNNGEMKKKENKRIFLGPAMWTVNRMDWTYTRTPNENRERPLLLLLMLLLLVVVSLPHYYVPTVLWIHIAVVFIYFICFAKAILPNTNLFTHTHTHITFHPLDSCKVRLRVSCVFICAQIWLSLCRYVCVYSQTW